MNIFKRQNVEMTQGPLFKKIIIFSLPLMLTGILQLLYNAADIIVVGKFSGERALAAVGSTGALTNLFVNVFIGLSLGANVVVARNIGAKNKEGVHRAVHTSMLLSAVGGVFVGAVGIIFAKPLLELMQTPSDIIDLSALYMRICFAGMPAALVYNFGASVLRAKGDTQRPLIFLMISGAVNVGLNLFFVIVCGMSVDGVAYATIISQYISVVMIIVCLMRQKDDCRLYLRKLRFYGQELKNVLRIGLPAGIQGSLFAVSNVIIQSSVNSFGSIVVAGNTAASNIENFIYISMNSIYQATLTFTSQNYGARQPKRMTRILWQSVCIVTVVGLIMGGLASFFGDKILLLYTSEPEVISYGSQRLWFICMTYFLCGIMEVLVGSLRGMNYSVMPMIVALLGACGFRILWIFTVFAVDRSLITLYLSYPLSWVLTDVVHFICYLIVKKKVNKRMSS